MAFLKNKKLRALIVIMSVLVAIGVLFSRYYYKSVNESFDPRTVPAKQLYSRYDQLASVNDFEGIFMLLDSIENVYKGIPHYENSYEIGVLYNNRAAALLTMAMHKDSITINSKFFSLQPADSLLGMAYQAVEKSIVIYEDWLANYGDKTEEELITLVEADFFSGLEKCSTKEKEKFFQSRVKELKNARYENRRRLSVALTNLGIVYRNLEKYELAARQYKKAIDLWDRNLVAENNLNILLGRPLRKRNIIQRLFPPKKDEKQ